MADCIGTGFLQFSCALVQIRFSIGENSCSHILKRGTSGGKTAKKRGNWKEGGKGKQRWGYVKDNSRTGGTTNKKNIFIIGCVYSNTSVTNKLKNYLYLNPFNHTLFLASKLKFGVKISDFRKFNMVDRFSKFAYSVSDPSS